MMSLLRSNQFAAPSVGVSPEVEPVGGYAMKPRQNQVLLFEIEGTGRSKSLIVGFCVKCMVDRRLVGSDLQRFSSPPCTIFDSRRGHGLNRRQQPVIFFLKRLVSAGSAAEIIHKLSGSDHCGEDSRPFGSNTQNTENIRCGGRSKYDYQEVEAAAPAFEHPLSRTVVYRVLKRVHPYELVLERVGRHLYSFFFGSAGAGLDDAGGEAIRLFLSGVRGFALRISVGESGRVVTIPKDIFNSSSAIKFVSRWSLHLGMIGAAGRWHALQPNHYSSFQPMFQRPLLTEKERA